MSPMAEMSHPQLVPASALPGPSDKTPDESPDDDVQGQGPEQVTEDEDRYLPGPHAWQLEMPSPEKPASHWHAWLPAVDVELDTQKEQSVAPVVF